MRHEKSAIVVAFVVTVAMLTLGVSQVAQSKELGAGTAREQGEQLRERAMMECAVRNWAGAEGLFEAALKLAPKNDTTGNVKAEIKKMLVEVRLHIAEPWRDCDNWECGMKGGQKAQAAGRTREALQYYLRAWERRAPSLAISRTSSYQPDLYYLIDASDESEKALLQTIADLARDMRSPLEIPEQAQVKLEEAIGEFKSTTTPAQTVRAERKLLDVVGMAPFWADAYRVLGGVAKTAGNCSVEIGALEMYVRIAPQDAGASAARSDIAECKRRTDL